MFDKKIFLLPCVALTIVILSGCGVGGVDGASVAGPSGGDTTPPVITSSLPAGQQAAGTTFVTMQVTTNESATCKYFTSDIAYASMPNTFAATGGTIHAQTISGLTDGGSYSYYIRCQDVSQNANTSSRHITWSVATGSSGTISLTWDAPTQYTDGSPLNPATDLQSYVLYYGIAPQTYTQVTTITNPGTSTVTQSMNLPSGTYFFVVTAVTTAVQGGQESDYSNEVSKTVY